jgi:acetyl-CoA acetyltransferase
VDYWWEIHQQQGATVTRLVITLLYELRRRKKKYGLATACIGGGQGIAMIVESMN